MAVNFETEPTVSRTFAIAAAASTQREMEGRVVQNIIEANWRSLGIVIDLPENVTKMVDKGVLAPAELEGSGTVILSEGKEVNVIAGEPIALSAFGVKGSKDKVTPLRPVTRENTVSDFR